MRALHAVALVFAMAGLATAQTPGDDDAERERRARALLLIGQAKMKCFVSIDAGRKEAVKDDKVLVVMVGKTALGCAEVVEAGAVGVKVAEYKSDDIGATDPARSRVIVLSKGTGGPKDKDTTALYIREVLPADVRSDDMRGAVKRVSAPSGGPKPDVGGALRWDVRTPYYIAPSGGTLSK